MKGTPRTPNSLRDRRSATGLSQVAFARQIGIAVTHYNALETGRSSPFQKNGRWRNLVLRVARFFACTPEAIFAGTPEAIVRCSDSTEENPLRARRFGAGLTQLELAARLGTKGPAYSILENGTKSPFCKDGRWNSLALRVACYFGCPPQDLFAHRVLDRVVPVIEEPEQIDLLASQLWPESDSALERLVRAEELADLEEALGRLSSRRRAVLGGYFGLDEEPEGTLAEVGERHGLSRERIRQLVLFAVCDLRERMGIVIPLPPPEQPRQVDQDFAAAALAAVRRANDPVAVAAAARRAVRRAATEARRAVRRAEAEARQAERDRVKAERRAVHRAAKAEEKQAAMARRVAEGAAIAERHAQWEREEAERQVQWDERSAENREWFKEWDRRRKQEEARAERHRSWISALAAKKEAHARALGPPPALVPPPIAAEDLVLAEWHLSPWVGPSELSRRYWQADGVQPQIAAEVRVVVIRAMTFPNWEVCPPPPMANALRGWPPPGSRMAPIAKGVERDSQLARACADLHVEDLIARRG